MTREMNATQQRILEFIRRNMQEMGCPPTNREIGEEVGIASTGHIDHHLSMLEKRGLIQRERKKSRGIRLIEQETPAERHGLRIHGTIAAGAPLDIYPDEQQDSLDLAAHTREYVLLVRGHSMIEDHIADGDFVLVSPDTYWHDGDIIVATHANGSAANGAATLKRIYREEDRVRLQPANSEMQPLYISAQEWENEWTVQGKVTAVYRRCAR